MFNSDSSLWSHRSYLLPAHVSGGKMAPAMFMCWIPKWHLDLWSNNELAILGKTAGTFCLFVCFSLRKWNWSACWENRLWRWPLNSPANSCPPHQTVYVITTFSLEGLFVGFGFLRSGCVLVCQWHGTQMFAPRVLCSWHFLVLGKQRILEMTWHLNLT